MGFDFEIIQNNINNNKYQLLGAGSGRYVYDLNNGYVVKAAKNRKGIVQNKAESEIASSDRSHIFAKVLDVSQDFHFLIMEKADRITSFAEVWRYYNVRNNRELFRLEEFRATLKKHNLLPADLHRQTSWGLIKGKPVIIDFGFTKEVSKYYTFFR